MPNRKPTAPLEPPTPEEIRRYKQRVGRRAMALRRERIFASLVIGKSYLSIAREEKCSVHWVRRIVADVLAQRQVEAPAEFRRLQIARLHYALEMATAFMTTIRKIEGLDRYLKIVEQLDRCYAYAPGAAVAAESPPAAALPGRCAGATRALPAPPPAAPIEAAADLNQPVSL